MVDLISLSIQAGDGGDGRISFLRTRYQLKGGPDGGDGGRGGNVILHGDRNLQSLRDYAGKSLIEAPSGQKGGTEKMHGKDAEDVVLRIPKGTVVWRAIDGFEPIVPFRMYSIDAEGERREWFLNPKRAHSLKVKAIPVHSAELTIDPETGAIVVESGEKAYRYKTFPTSRGEVEAVYIGEVTEDGEELVIARGGKGGRGNFEFRSSTHTTPKEAETGEKAERGLFFFELLMLADVGLVGLPNVGKSTLLSVLTNANPRIANYPFTTLEPNLGILQFDSVDSQQRDSYLMADIPGIIEGANIGKGLGIAFLRHIERCRVLIFVLSLEDHEMIEVAKDPEAYIQAIQRQYLLLEEELTLYENSIRERATKKTRMQQLSTKKRVIVLGKADLVSPSEQEHLLKAAQVVWKDVQFISGKTLVGIDSLKQTLHEVLNQT